MQQKAEHTDLVRSREINNIIGKPPHWLMNWGITIYTLVLVMLAVLGILIKYPEITTVSVKIHRVIPSIAVSSKENTFIYKIWVNEGKNVRENDTILTFKNDISSKLNFAYLTAPAGGKINFSSPCEISQYLKSGQVVFFITPKIDSFFAAAYITDSGISKIKIGQDANIKLTAYPNQIYGSIKGTISYVSGLATDEGYLVKIAFPDGLKSNRGNEIIFKEGLNGNADILIKRGKLVQKIFNKSF